jgi:hypothetical protein
VTDLLKSTQTPEQYAAAAKLTIGLLFDAANGSRGRVLDWVAVRHLASYIQNLEQGLHKLTMAAMAQDNIIAAYTNEYGEDLLNELTSEGVVDGIIEDEEEARHPGETIGVDTQAEREKE